MKVKSSLFLKSKNTCQLIFSIGFALVYEFRLFYLLFTIYYILSLIFILQREACQYLLSTMPGKSHQAFQLHLSASWSHFKFL